MLKFLPVGIVVILMVGVLVYLRFFSMQPSTKQNNSTIATVNTSTAPAANSSASSLEDRVKVLEELITVLARRTNESSSGNDTIPNQTTPTNHEARIIILEQQVDNLQKGLNEQPVTGEVTPSAKNAPLYIPLGWNASSGAFDWTSVSSQDITIDPADYPGYKNMQLEISLRVFQGNGKAYARLYNNDDNVALLTSEVSTTSQNYNWVISSGFTLSSGKKTYSLQLKSLTGYDAGVQSARIRVNY